MTGSSSSLESPSTEVPLLDGNLELGPVGLVTHVVVVDLYEHLLQDVRWPGTYTAYPIRSTP